MRNWPSNQLEDEVLLLSKSEPRRALLRAAEAACCRLSNIQGVSRIDDAVDCFGREYIVHVAACVFYDCDSFGLIATPEIFDRTLLVRRDRQPSQGTIEAGSWCSMLKRLAMSARFDLTRIVTLESYARSIEESGFKPSPNDFIVEGFEKAWSSVAESLRKGLQNCDLTLVYEEVFKELHAIEFAPADSEKANAPIVDHSPSPAEPWLGIQLNDDRMTATRGGVSVAFTERLLWNFFCQLVERRGDRWTRDRISEEWERMGGLGEGDTSIDTSLTKLRKQISLLALSIRNVKNGGWWISELRDSSASN